jgi:hypothetical protein
MLDRILQDIRIGARTLAERPLFPAVTLLALTTGMGEVRVWRRAVR